MWTLSLRIIVEGVTKHSPFKLVSICGINCWISSWKSTRAYVVDNWNLPWMQIEIRSWTCYGQDKSKNSNFAICTIVSGHLPSIVNKTTSSLVENIKHAKGNECSQYKSIVAIFSSNLPICLVYFHLVMPQHVLSPCYALYEHTRGIKGYVTYYLACYVRLQVQNMPWCHLRKYGWGKWTD